MVIFGTEYSDCLTGEFARSVVEMDVRDTDLMLVNLALSVTLFVISACAGMEAPCTLLELVVDSAASSEMYYLYGTEYSVCFTIKCTLNELARLLLKLLVALRTFHGTACKALFVSILFIKTLVH